jgi:hypothetical protein
VLTFGGAPSVRFYGEGKIIHSIDQLKENCKERELMYQVIPRKTSGSTLDLWVGIWEELLTPATKRLLIRTPGSIVQAINLPDSNWAKRGTPAKKRVWWTYVPVPNLQPDTEYTCELLVGGNTVASGVASTLPRYLPQQGGGNNPFNVFVGSCFFLQNDPNMRVPDAYVHLWNSQWKTPIKFLCGDQIYFDLSPFDFTPKKDIRRFIRTRLTNKYRYTWLALEPMLSRGTNYLLTDDHEYWNDYPRRAGAPWVFSFHSADNYLQTRTQGFANDFQSAGLADGFNIGNDLQFRVLDTRRHRDLNAKTFAQQQDVASIIQWLHNLRSPGVLVLSSPIFVDPQETKSFNFGLTDGTVITDTNLPFFDAQFVPLAHALLETKVDVVVVAGDPHFSRIAQCDVPSNPANGNSAHKIIEVVSSAMATAPFAGNNAKAGPNVFPLANQAHQAIPSSQIQYLNSSSSKPNGKEAADNFVTLSFTSNHILNREVNMRVRSWFCKRRNNSQPPIPVDFDRTFTLKGIPINPRVPGEILEIAVELSTTGRTLDPSSAQILRNSGIDRTLATYIQGILPQPLQPRDPNPAGRNRG